MSRARLEHACRTPLAHMLPGKLGVSLHPEPLLPRLAMAAAITREQRQDRSG